MKPKDKCKETVVLISALLWLFVKCCSCQSPCVNEVVADRDFSISMKEHIQEEAENCVLIHYNLTVPGMKEFFPYEKVWFEGNPSNVRDLQMVKAIKSDRPHVFRINGLPPGEYEYGLRLKWGCNQSYIFPKRVKISVTELTWQPYLRLSPSVEGKPTTIRCFAPHLCSGDANIKLKWTKRGGQPRDLDQWGFTPFRHHSHRDIVPTADDHNTTVTCVAEYRNSVINSTAVLNVQFPPKIQRGSECWLKGKVLVCVCVSRGNPLPPITWPLEILTDYSVTSWSSSHTVTSTLTLRVDNYPNTTMRCISSNNLGWDQQEIQFQNGSEATDSLDCEQTYNAGILSGAAVSLGLNVVLITALVVFIYKQRKSKQRKHNEETDVYTSLRKADVEQVYSVISPQAT